MKNITIIIPTYNRPELLHRLLLDIYDNNKPENFKLFVVDDGSTQNYEMVINKFKDNKNFTYIRNEKNEGKNKALYSVFMKLKMTDYVLIMDDKNRFQYSLLNIISNSVKENEVIGFDLYDSNSSNLIGNEKLQKNISIHDFYFKNHNTGDKLWIFKLYRIKLKELESFFVQGETAYEDCFWTHYLWDCKIIETISCLNIQHEYLDTGVSKNIKNYQINNPITYLNFLIIYFQGLQAFPYKIWYFFLIKKQIKNIKQNIPFDKKFKNFKYSFITIILYVPLNVLFLLKR